MATATIKELPGHAPLTPAEFRLKVEKAQAVILDVRTDLVPGQWTHVKIELHGSSARLYVNHSGQPALIVNELKQSVRAGAIALWIGPGIPNKELEEAIVPDRLLRSVEE